MSDVKNPNEHYGKKYFSSLNSVKKCYSYSHGFTNYPNMELHIAECSGINDKCLTVNITKNEVKASWLGCASDYCKITKNPCNISNFIDGCNANLASINGDSSYYSLCTCSYNLCNSSYRNHSLSTLHLLTLVFVILLQKFFYK
uniref:UPAR/Ly6 domain-containing protein n=1 Tax=Strongyloides venezuelensis TaxID=75913 RepID=A0A0K0FQI2_STRVS